MANFDPRIRLRRLQVHKGRRVAFDHTFSNGLNLFAGANGSGKSTIADFVMFALGGEPANWRKAALECDFVAAEVELNATIVTLSRDIEGGTPRRPIRIF